MLDPHYLYIFILIISLSAFTQGFTGLGFGITAMAALAFTPWNLERASVILNLLLVPLIFAVILAGRKDFQINWKLVAVALLGEAVGVPAGYWFIFTFSNQPIFRFLFGLTLVTFALIYFFRPRPKTMLPISYGFLAGIAGGFSTGAFNAGGPPMALFVYTRHADPAAAKGTLQVIFMVAAIWRLIWIALFGGGITYQILKISAITVLLVMMCASIGHFLTRRVPSQLFARIVYTFIGLAGILNVVRSLL